MNLVENLGGTTLRSLHLISLTPGGKPPFAIFEAVQNLGPKTGKFFGIFYLYELNVI